MLDLTNLSTIKTILKDNRLRAKKSFGQNFLVSKHPLDQLIKSANISDDEVVIEVGPGLGVLTQELARKAGLVLAIEKDYGFVQYLRKYFKNCKNVKIIHADVLQLAISDLRLANYKVVSNLPYNVTSPVIRKFLEAGDVARSSLSPYNPITLQPSLMVLTVQKEVAERICAKPGNSERGILTVMVEFYGQAEIVEIVGRENFWPSPIVDSAIIKIRVSPRKVSVDPRLFFRIVKIGFSQKRRQIHNPLSAGLHLSKDKILDILNKANIDRKLRAEDLTLNDWAKLTQVLVNR